MGTRRLPVVLLAIAMAFPVSLPPVGAGSAAASTAVVPHFANVTEETGLGALRTALSPMAAQQEDQAGFLNGGKGAAWFDYDQDGWEDILIGGVYSRELHRNNGDGTFTDATNASGLKGSLYTMSVITPDFNNDGYPDVVFGNWHGRNEIFLNNGNGTFRNVTSAWNFLVNGPTSGMAFGDLDGDGYGELLICEYYRRSNLLFHNLNGQGIEDVTKRAGVGDPDGYKFQPLMFDYDRDGDLDIYDVNDFGADALFRNEGNFNFTDVSVEAGVAIRGDGMGGAIGDINDDGYMDVFVTNFGDDHLLVYDPANRTFRDDHMWRGFYDIDVGWGVNIADFNNDGYLDIFVADGRVVIGQVGQPDRFWINQGNGTFVESAAEAGVRDFGVNRGSAVADFDQDGNLDLWVSNVVASSSAYRNEGTGNHWLEVKLLGIVSMRDAVGAKLTLEADGRTQTRFVHQGSSYLSQDSLIQHFGLGAATTVTRLSIEWPSGVRQEFADLAADQRLSIVEDESNAPVARAPDVFADAGVEIRLDGSASTDDTRIVAWNWTFDGPYSTMALFGPSPPATFYDPANVTGTLTVTDAFDNSNSTTFNVTIRPVGHPLVDAGPDLRIAQNATAAFSATLRGGPAWDDYSNTTFAWTFEGPDGTTTLTGRNVSRAFPVPGVYLVTVVATDLFAATGNDTVLVFVGDSDPPIIVFSPPESVPEDTAFTLDASRSTDNDPSFAATGLFYWRMSGALGQYEIRIGPVAEFSLRDPGVAKFILEVNDTDGNVATMLFEIEAIDGTRPTAEGGGDRVTLAGSTVTLDASLSADNDPAFRDRGTFEWNYVGPDGVGRSLGITVPIVLTNPGVTTVRLHVTDPSGNAALVDDVFNITALDRTAPTLPRLADQNITFGSATRFDGGGATDNDPAFVFTATYTWVVVDGTALKTFQGVTVDYTFSRVGRWPVSLTVTDAAGNSARSNFTVAVVDRTAPVLEASVAAQALVGDPVALDADNSTDDVGIAAFVWSFDGPVAIQPVNGRYLRWIFNTAGNYTVTITIRDAAGNTVTRSFAVAVASADAPPLPPPPPPGIDTTTGPTPGVGAGAAALAAGGVLAAGVAVILALRLRRQGQA